MSQIQRRRDCHACGSDGPGCDKCYGCIVCKKRFFRKMSSTQERCVDCKGSVVLQQNNTLVENAQECAKNEGVLRKQAEQKYADLQKKVVANRTIVAELQHSLRMAQQTLKQQADAHAQELRNRDSLECQLRAEIYDAKSQVSIMTLIAIAIMCLFLRIALK